MLRYIACVKYCTINIGSNAMYVKYVESRSILNYKGSNAVYVEGVKRN